MEADAIAFYDIMQCVQVRRCLPARAALVRIENDLFDEYRICIAPVLVGAGTPLFKPLSQNKPMKVRESKTLKKGGVILYCVPDRS